jgi:glycosyltransferase involved in cell wall biosynthesis
MKIQLQELDLLKPWPAMSLGSGYHAVRVLVRLGKIPVGEVMTRPSRRGTVIPQRLARRIARRLMFPLLKLLSRRALSAGPSVIAALPEMPGRPIGSGSTWKKAGEKFLRQILLPGGLPEPWAGLCVAADANERFALPPITVAVCTRDRPDELQGCIQHLLELDYPDFDVLICDNSRDAGPTRQIAETLGVGYVRESTAGLSRARNAALKAARHRWVAFTDDDCRPESNWLREMARELQDTQCRCVCGLVLPAQLENSAEITFEIYGGLGRGYFPIVFDPSFITKERWAPAATWRIGAGANMLLDADLVNELGGYDTDMGPGGVGGCGEDTLVFYQMLKKRFNIHYTPTAIVHHFHRSSDAALRKQIYSYAVGHAAYHARVLWSYGDYRSLLQLIHHLPRWFVRNFRKALGARTRYPLSLVPLEAKGTVVGVVKYTAVKLRRLLQSIGFRRAAKTKENAAALPGDLPAASQSNSTQNYDVPPVKKSFRAA